MLNKKPSYKDLEKQISELKAEIKLNHIENYFKMLVKASDDMITTHKPNGEYLYFNGPLCFGLTAKEIVGKMPSDLFDKNVSNLIFNAFKKVEKTGNSETIEVLLDCLGEKKWFSECIYPVKNIDGDVVELVKVSKDINKWKLAEQKIQEQNKEKKKRVQELELSRQKVQTTLELLEKRKHSMDEASKVANIGYWEHNILTDTVIWSDYIYYLFGLNPKNGIPAQDKILKMLCTVSQEKLEKATLNLLTNGIAYDIELKFINHKKNQVWIRNVAAPIYNKQNEIVGKRGVMQNITVSKKAQHKLELSKVELQNSLILLEKRDYALKESSRIAKIGHWEYIIATDTFIWSDYVYEVYGFDLKDSIPTRNEIVELYDKESQEKLVNATLTLTSKRIPYDIELKLINKKNEEIWVRNVVQLIYNDKNEIVGRRGVVHNITDSKKAQLALEKSKLKAETSLNLLEEKENALHEVSSMAKIGYWEYSNKNNAIVWSDYHFNIFGLDPEEGIPSREKILSYFDIQSQKKIDKANYSLTNKGVSYDIEVKLTNNKNEEVWVRNVVQPVYNKQNRIIGRRGLLQNITDSKNAQFQLENSKNKIQSSLELAEKKDYSLKEASKMAKIGHWEYDSVKDKLIWSEYVYQVFGCNPKKPPIPLEEHVKLFDKKSRKKIKQAILDLTLKSIPYDIELKLTNLKEEEIWVRSVAQPVFNNKNQIIGRRGVFHNITDSKKTQFQLEYSNKKFQESLKLLEKRDYSMSEASKIAKIGFLETNLITGTRIWSKYLYTIFGLDSKDKIPSREKILEFLDEESLKKITEASIKMENHGIPLDLELKIINLNKEKIWLRVVIHPVYNKQNKIIAVRGVVQDITDSKKSQLQLEFSRQKIKDSLVLLEKSEYAKNEASKMAKIGYLEDDIINDTRKWSDYLYYIFGFDPKKGIPTREDIAALFEKKYQKKIAKAALKLDNEGVSFDIELKMTNLRNEKVWLRVAIEPVYNQQHKIVGRRGIVQNITDSKNAQQELELSTNKLQTLLEETKENEYLLKEASRMANIGYWGFDKETNTINWSDSLHKIYGTEIKDGVPEIETILGVFTEESRKKLVEATEILASKGIPFEIELQMTNLKSEEKWILNIGEAIFNEQNQIIGRRGVTQDITQRKLTQKVLDEKNKKLFELNNTLNQAQKLSNVGSWHWNMTTDKAEWSDEMYNIYGVTRENFYPSNENVSKTVLPEDLYKIEQGVSSLLVNKIFVPFEFRIMRPSGEIRTLFIMALEKKSQESIFGVTKDITNQKKIEEKNLFITKKYKELFENATVSIWNEDLRLVFEEIEKLRKLNILNIKDYLSKNPEIVLLLQKKIKVNNVNKATLKLFKIKNKKEFLKNIQITFSDDSNNVFKNFIISIWNKEKTFTSEINYRTLDGIKFAAIVSIPIPQTIIEQKTVPVSIQSIQSIKEAELAKKESLRKLKEAQKLAKVGSWLYIPSTKKIEWSDEMFSIFGFDPKKTVPNFETQENLIHKDDKEFVLNAIGLGKPFDIEHRVLLLNGEQKWIRAICKPIINEKGEVISLSGTNQDITVQKLARLEIEKADEMYRLLTDNSNDLICLHETNSTFRYISPSIKTLLGYEQSELIGKPGFNIIYKDDVLNFEKAIIGNVTNENNNHSFIFRVIHKKGDILWFEFTTSKVLKDNKIKFIMTSSRDVTNEVLAKERIQKYQTSLQKLTTEITLIEEKQKKEIATNIHDHLSQSLVISRMKINELKKKSQLKVISEDLQFIEKHISEALDNSRKITYELSPPILYQLGIIEALNWLLDKVETTHKITCIINSNLSSVKLSDVKSILLFRSIQEVINNAIKYAEASLITLDIEKNEFGLTIFVTDNGIGFNTSSLNNLHNHSGSGFGLFTVQERIQNIQGKFTIKSKINVGTTVKFLIPLSE